MNILQLLREKISAMTLEDNKEHAPALIHAREVITTQIAEAKRRTRDDAVCIPPNNGITWHIQHRVCHDIVDELKRAGFVAKCDTNESTENDGGVDYSSQYFVIRVGGINKIN